MVTTGDLISMDENTVPVHNNIPIVKLWENQKVVLEAVVEVNYGKEHAKWQPTLACWSYVITQPPLLLMKQTVNVSVS